MRKLDVFCFANFQQGWRSEDDVYSFANSVLSGYWVSLLVIGLKTDSLLLRVSVISCRKSQQLFVIEMVVWITWLCGKCWPLLTFLTLFAFCYLHFEALHSKTAALSTDCIISNWLKHLLKLVWKITYWKLHFLLLIDSVMHLNTTMNKKCWLFDFSIHGENILG